jgi:hypothetical protein
MRILLLFFAGLGLMAAQTRTVNLSWTASVSAGVTGYTISTGASATGTFTFKGCTGVVPSQTCVPGSTASTNAYQDSETTGTTVFYQVVAIAAACTATTPVTQACGTSAPATISTTVPPQPGITTVIVSIP